MHEDRNGNETCNGTCPDDRERCKGCEEPTEECACEDVTAEIPAELAREVVAVSEAEAVRRQFRDELVKAMANAEKGRKQGYPYLYGSLAGGLECILIRLCGFSAAEAMAARDGRL